MRTKKLHPVVNDDLFVADRKIGPYTFKFAIRGDHNFLMLFENDEKIWESAPITRGDDHNMRQRIQVGLAVLVSRLATLQEKTLATIHQLTQ